MDNKLPKERESLYKADSCCTTETTTNLDGQGKQSSLENTVLSSSIDESPTKSLFKTQSDDSINANSSICDPPDAKIETVQTTGLCPTLKLSKNQLKKRRRYERALEIKKRRKEQTRQIRHLQAVQQGRNIEAERQIELANRISGVGRQRREEKWRQLLRDAKTDESFRVCFDCSFEKLMTAKEVNSLSLQLRYAYAANKKSRYPVNVSVVSLGGETRGHLEKVAGFPNAWEKRAFRCFKEGIEEVYELKTNDESGKGPRLVYLTGDSETTLTKLEEGLTYIIGGIVDRNRLKRLAADRAEELGIPTARLPLDDYVKFHGSTRVLTCNHVFEILLKFRENGCKDWGGVIMNVLPDRKEIESIDHGDSRGIDKDEKGNDRDGSEEGDTTNKEKCVN